VRDSAVHYLVPSPGGLLGAECLSLAGSWCFSLAGALSPHRLPSASSCMAPPQASPSALLHVPSMCPHPSCSLIGPIEIPKQGRLVRLLWCASQGEHGMLADAHPQQSALLSL
jgi:hypothetical protein